MAVKLAFAAASAVASVAQAAATSANAKAGLELTRAQVEAERSTAQTRAMQDEADRAKRFRSSLAAQNAVAASRGISLSTFDGIKAGDREQYESDLRTIGLNKESKLYQLSIYEANAAREASYATKSAWMGAFGNIAKLGYGYYASQGGAPGKKPDSGGPAGDYGRTFGGPR